MLECRRSGNVESLEHRAADIDVASVELRDVGVDNICVQGQRGLLNLEMLTAQFALQDRDGLREGMTSVMRWNVGPQQLDQSVTRDTPAGVECQADEQREVLARAKPHRLA